MTDESRLMVEDETRNLRRDTQIGRAAFAVLILSVAAATALGHYYVKDLKRGGGPWRLGDWLIDYSGGFVRRGLFGELVGVVAPQGVGALYLVVGIQVLCYALLTVYFWRYLVRENFSWSGIALTLSPAALCFVGWDPAGGFRKEILAFVVLVMLAVARSSSRAGVSLVLRASGAALYVAAVLSWEGSAFMLPAVLFLLLGDTAAGESRPQRRAFAAVFAGIAVGGAGLAIFAHGSSATSATICTSLRARGLHGEDLCAGAIDALGWSLGRNVSDVVSSFPLYLGYVPLIALAALPIVASQWFQRNWRWALATALGILPLYAIAIDWGRWTHILATSLAVCITAGRPGDSYSRVWTPLGSVLFVSLWGIPHYAWTPKVSIGFMHTPVDFIVTLFKLWLTRDL